MPWVRVEGRSVLVVLAGRFGVWVCRCELLRRRFGFSALVLWRALVPLW